jgi:hypothetical protein
MSELIENTIQNIIVELQKLLPPASMEQVIRHGTSDYLPNLYPFARKVVSLGWKIVEVGNIIQSNQDDPVPSNEAKYLEWISFHLSNAEDSLESALKMLEKLSGYMNPSISIGELLKED